MRYWWVNQNQTYRHEIAGGYLWSPKRNKNGARNPFYESMREVSPGDIIISFSDTRIAALGIAGSFCEESPLPTEFGTVGLQWSHGIGWRVDVHFRELRNRIRPKDHMGVLAPLLPEKYAPLQKDGDGLQSVYLAGVSEAFATTLFGLIGAETASVLAAAQATARSVDSANIPDITREEWERRVELDILEDSHVPETERTTLVQARRGQGVFRTNVQLIETACRITKVTHLEHLVASHMKPWRDGTNEERLNGENGLLLTPSIDHLFDKGFISFENGGDLILSPVADRASLVRMGVPVDARVNVGGFTEGQRKFLDYHRESVLKQSRQAGGRAKNRRNVLFNGD
ncbi:MAG: HNH endonuclease [Proteobacteria bacterium]|nr:HNH endonuclease [Pseudomonadota bacterium]